MLERFLEFIKKHALINEDDQLLLAVSGGVDSMTLLNLFSQTRYSFAVAHCNFQLRGGEADKDERLVKESCELLNVDFHSIRFETKAYAQKNGISTQMAARELRYQWFEELQKAHAYDKVVLAHHRDDSIETFFLNLTRGTSLRGLRGIQPINDELIRPLLPFSKDEILEFARNEGISWREDASNKETHYKRNLIRHELLPILKKLNSDFEKVMTENLEKLDLRYEASESMYRSLRKELIVANNGSFSIQKDLLKERCHSAYDIYELLREFRFNYPVCKQLFNSFERVGAKFKSDTHILLIDRNELLVYTEESADLEEALMIESGARQFLANQVRYSLQLIAKSDWQMDGNSKNGAFDAELLQFPLQVRPWQEGDRVQPLGMKGSKLVSDLLIDQKVPLIHKPKVLVMLSGQEIVWVIGLRISEKFKVTDKTKQVLVAKAEV